MRTSVLWAAACALAASAPAGALPVAVVEGDVRYRLESVEQAGFAGDALASTLRTRLGLRTTAWHGLRGYAGFEDIRAIGDDRYDSTANGRTDLPVVPDPEDTELDQAWIGWTGGPLEVRAGRQRLVLDNQRFVGPVGFRQNQQTFDGVTANLVLGGGTLFYGWLGNANRVFGEHHPDPARADLDLDAHLLNYGRRFGSLRVTTYAYLLELPDQPAQSHADVGLRLAAEPALRDSGWYLPFTVEYARQFDYAQAPGTVDAAYLLVETGARWRRTEFKAGYEELGGDGTWAFATPLATLHAFNGWADRFTATPAAGLRDLYAEVSHALGAFDAIVAYHDYAPDTGPGRHGTEWNTAVGLKPSRQTMLRLEYADYRARDFGADTRIVWFTAGLTF
jgi:hypothetical protein